MTATRDNGIPRPAGGKPGNTTPRREDGAARKQGSAPTRFKVQCPNPACRKVHTAKTSWAGMKSKCPDCGAALIIPNVSASRTGDRAAGAPRSSPKEGRSRAADIDGAAQLREERPQRNGAEVREVRVGCIGRGHAGKTALFRALDEGPVGGFFPSGLHVDVGDPREVAKLIRETEETRRILQRSGLPPTLQAAQIRYYLYDHDEQRVVYKMHEVIGQVLTHTLPDSAVDQQTKYSWYLKNLVNTHVLWAMVPCLPPNPGARDRRRYANDLRITLAYLREALRLRSLEQPVAVALVISKIDVLFEDAEEARASLTDQVLCKALGPLVHLLDQSARVSEAVIIPVTSFGFGNAVLHASASARAGTPPSSADEPFEPEPIWLLREGAALEPFNLDTLFLWTLLFGLLNQAGPGVAKTEPQIDEVCRTLRGDLDAGNPWLLPIKGGLAT
jgi:hypothetical protein